MTDEPGNLLEDALEQAMYARLADPEVLTRFLVKALQDQQHPAALQDQARALLAALQDGQGAIDDLDRPDRPGLN